MQSMMDCTICAFVISRARGILTSASAGSSGTEGLAFRQTPWQTLDGCPAGRTPLHIRPSFRSRQ